jgi:hypothetical protein
VYVLVKICIFRQFLSLFPDLFRVDFRLLDRLKLCACDRCKVVECLSSLWCDNDGLAVRVQEAVDAVGQGGPGIWKSDEGYKLIDVCDNVMTITNTPKTKETNTSAWSHL